MIDVVTVCAGKDLENISTCIQSLNKNLDINTIYVITNDTNAVPKLKNVIAIDENQIISRNKVIDLKKIAFPFYEKRFGWYYQQFLKMEFSRSKYCTGNYLIWDADTILLKRINFFDQNLSIFTKGKEKLNENYVNTYKKILGIENKFTYSLISQHLFVKKDIMQKMIIKIEDRFNNYFAEAILKNITGNSPSLFSEYETYVNYYASVSSDYRIVERKWFRNAAAVCDFGSDLNTIADRFTDCDYVAMEKFDTTFKGKLKGTLKYYFYKSKQLFGM
ncbi:hypothetical protein GKR48_10805 [Providencia sp. wls1943]|nr:DUF6492 family protein [Providencia sp. wls1943]MTB67308.1 hypothetical protein [Providencia sp. wls1943]